MSQQSKSALSGVGDCSVAYNIAQTPACQFVFMSRGDERREAARGKWVEEKQQGSNWWEEVWIHKDQDNFATSEGFRLLEYLGVGAVKNVSELCWKYCSCSVFVSAEHIWGIYSLLRRRQTISHRPQAPQRCKRPTSLTLTEQTCSKAMCTCVYKYFYRCFELRNRRDRPYNGLHACIHVKAHRTVEQAVRHVCNTHAAR